MLQQGPELTQDAPASADSESAEPENPSEMPEPPDVDMTETDVSDGSSEMRKFQLHWLQLHKWLKFDSKLNKMFVKLKIATNMSRRREIEAPSNARIVFGPGGFAPLGPPTGALPLDPTGGPPAQLGPMEICADGPLAHQQKFPTISLKTYVN